MKPLNRTRVWFCSSHPRTVAAFLISVALFLVFPRLDSTIAHWFYANGTFILADNVLVQLSYKVFANLHFFLLPILLAVACFSGLTQKHPKLRKQCSFLLLVLVLGPGLLVNVGLKDNSFGRPRPNQTTGFMGIAEYAAPFEYSGVCRKNCSFVSGHASLAFSLMAIAWAFRRKEWVWIGFCIGCLAGLGRIMQGAHYLSDVVFSFWATYLVIRVLANKYNLNPVTRSKFDDHVITASAN